MAGLLAGDGRRVLGGRLLLRPPAAPDAGRADRPDQRRLGRLGVRGLDPPRPAGRGSRSMRRCSSAGSRSRRTIPGPRPSTSRNWPSGSSQPRRPRPRASSRRGAREPRRHDERQRPARQHLQRRAQADDRLRHPRRHLVSGRIERRPGLSVSRPVPAHDQELARRVGPGRFPVLLGPARRLPGREARAAKAPGPSCARRRR